MKMPILRPAALGVALACSFALPAVAADDAPAPGSKTAIDRETGRLRATTAAEDRELERDAARLAVEARGKTAPGVAALVRPATESEALQTQVRHADGTVSMQVPESLDSQLVVTRDADGRLVVTHAGAQAEGHDHD
ncbi:post-PEP-CTERM-1 domain-containing protein [Arenimonas sp.]|uniref:post-PEP-CTERM-1 domain-containing protein n=1 Tax=Arenimonas sp. TaxID=1872635 RepID=UPI002E2FD469|nr:hypothetical protein [Arenimonas sp.]HEX4854164.1 hypothetical protein [Arenimonas sp.]